MILSIINQKGGVGKTTSTFNLGAILADMGKKVLLIDIDPQASLTVSFGLGVQASFSGNYTLSSKLFRLIATELC